MQIHTRSANSKWLDEIAHTNPLWIHPSHAATLGLATGDLVRVETRIGHFVVKAWVTEGIRPGVVACSHHMGRWKLPDGPGQRQMMATVSLRHEGTRWLLRRERNVEPFASADPDTSRIWWTDAGVHQNLTFPVQPDPVSGMHCWHQAVRVKRALPGDRYGDVSVDTAKSRAAYAEWLALARPASHHSPDGTRRPYWLLRPLKPGREVYKLPGRTASEAVTRFAKLRDALPGDLQAGLTVALVGLPQCLAYALLSGLPPAYGLSTAVAAGLVAALLGQSAQVVTGPTNTTGLLILAALAPSLGANGLLADGGLPALATLTLLVGAIRLVAALARRRRSSCASCRSRCWWASRPAPES